MKKIFLFIAFSFSFFTFGQENLVASPNTQNAPEWVKYMYSESVNLYTLMEMYDAYYESNTFQKNRDTQYFKRFVRINIDFVEKDGSLQEIHVPERVPNVSKAPTSPWEEMGPWNYDPEQAMQFFVQSPGAAHVYTVEQSPLNADLVFAGTATAGLWKTDNKGENWSLLTQNLAVNSVYSIALDPTNEDVIYFGEGDGYIWKSVDGGQNWAVTGGGGFLLTTKFVRELRYIGVNTLLAATNQGLFRTTDGGANWVTVNAGEHMEIEIHPTDPNTLYAVKLNGDKTEFVKSTDNGVTWTLSGTGWPTPATGDEQKRVEIGVSKDDPNKVVAWASGVEGANSGFYGLYVSNDSGDTFTFQCCGTAAGGTATVDNPNMLGWSEDGTEDGGQYYYDLAFAVSPNNADRMFGSGINVWRSVNEGVDWELNAHWVSWVGPNTVDRYSHADVHDIKFFENGTDVDMWIASDGGVFYSADQGDHIVPKMQGIHGTDFWGFQAGFHDGDVMLGGTYHNGTLVKYKDIYKGGNIDPNSGGWLAELGGDNFRGFVNFGDNSIAYADNGAFQFSGDRTIRQSGLPFDNSKKCNASYWISENGMYGFDPTNYNHIYSPVGSEMYESYDGGVSWTLLHDFGGSDLLEIHVSWANTDVIYVTHKQSSGIYRIHKTIDAGLNWEDVTPTASEASSNQYRPKAIALDAKDPNKLWVALMGSFNSDKVFESVDGGNTWSSISSATINAQNIISIAHHKGSDNGLYLGCYNNVFYKSDNTSDWESFNNNLPAAINNNFLQPFYGQSKIRVAGNRSVYQCDFYENAKPVAMIAADKKSFNMSASCASDSVMFVDHSTVDTLNATWSWSFEGGLPATSSLRSPVVYYTNPGTYSVKLVVTDQFGSDSVEIDNFMTVTNNILPSGITENFDGTLFPPANWKLLSNGNGSWEHDNPENDVNNGVASFPNYWEDATGSEQYLVLPSQDFTQGTDNNLSFYYTYNNNGSYTDSLAVVYRTASNSNWQTVWQKGGSQLNVAGTDVWFWYDADPSINWQMAQVDLSFLNNENCVELAFSNIGTNGNHIWVDSVNLVADNHVGLNSLNELNVSVYPNPSNSSVNVRAQFIIDEVVLKDMNGKVIYSMKDTGAKNVKLNVDTIASGVYFLEVKSGSKIAIKKVIVE